MSPGTRDGAGGFGEALVGMTSPPSALPAVEPYRPDVHYPILEGWWEGWKQTPPGPETLPATGFVVADLAAGFLYRTDSSLALIESLVANPASRAEARDAALDAVVEAIAEAAQAAGFDILLAYSSVPAVLRRAQRRGFVVISKTYTLAARSLRP